MGDIEFALDGGPRVPRRLPQSIAAGECVLFAGAGVASAAGYPDWEGVLSGVLRSLQNSDSRRWQDLHRQIEAGETQLVAELLRARLSELDLFELVRREFNEPGPSSRMNAALLSSIRRTSWSGVITNIWAPLLDEVLATPETIPLSPLSDHEFPDVFRAGGKRFLLRAYGDLTTPSSFLFSFEDYRRVVSESRAYEVFLETLLNRRTLLFIGTSIEGIEQFCIASTLWEPTERAHFAVVPHSSSFELHQERIRRRFGIELLAADARRLPEALHGFISRVAESAGRRRRPPVEEEQPAHERVERVRLHNIGPFTELDLDLSGEQTAVLLGDNGSGKTTILRAIAVALCGGSAETVLVPARLLRSGAKSGFIEVETGSGSYRTVLRRERDVVRTDARRVSPVEQGALLAIGVPSLRGAQAPVQLTSTQHSAQAPTAADLLPLVQDVVDSRITDLTAWIIRHDLVSRDPRHPSGPKRRRLLEAFFDTLRALTPGVDFEFAGVDADAGDVLLNTEDGRIPLALLSQGMSSMLAWVGVLLQRLSEVNEDSLTLQAAPALLLVDELDAHLHPLWQWKLLPLLREHFPSVQIIATTHSPLVVANSRPGELVHVRRSREGLVAQRLDRPFAGWRSDQILTHPLFGLSTTMDWETAAAMERYRQLLGRVQRSRDEDREVVQLAERLGEQLPSPEETDEARRAGQLLQDFLDSWFDRQIAGMPAEERRRITNEAQLELMRMYGEA